jgi:DNA-binding NarL/FixJ family response regulator
MHQASGTTEPRPKGKPIRVLIVEDQNLFAAMLLEILAAQPGFQVVGSVGTAAAAEELMRRIEADVVMLDLMLPDRSGLELIELLVARNTGTRIVVCTAANHPAAITMAYGLGAHAFIEKTSGIPDVIETLRRAARGEYCLTPRAAEVLRDHARGHGDNRLLQTGDLGVLRRLALHEPVRDIAAHVNLSASGVYKVRQRIARATGARTKRDFYLLAVRLGLVPGAATLPAATGAAEEEATA